jgi:hypothetical protein
MQNYTGTGPDNKIKSLLIIPVPVQFFQGCESGPKNVRKNKIFIKFYFMFITERYRNR